MKKVNTRPKPAKEPTPTHGRQKTKLQIDSNEMKENHSDFILFKTEDEKISVSVRFIDETVWLTQEQMATLFERDRSVIVKHIAKIFSEGELEEKSNVQFLHIANSDKPVKFYNLNVIMKQYGCRKK